MPTKRTGLHEIRTRVTGHLPVNTFQEEKAFFKILEYLKELRGQDIGVSGYTFSDVRPAVFHGCWWPESSDEQVEDQIVLLSVDYLLPLGSRELSNKVADFKPTIKKWYRYYQSPQEEIWLVAHPIIRQD